MGAQRSGDAGREVDEWRTRPSLAERGEITQDLVAHCSVWRSKSSLCRHVIVRAAIEVAPALCLLHATPLLEKEQASLLIALLLDRVDPRWLHGSCAMPTFSPNN